MKTEHFSETLVPIYQIAWRHIPDDGNLYIYHCDDLNIIHCRKWFVALSILNDAYFLKRGARKCATYNLL